MGDGADGTLRMYAAMVEEELARRVAEKGLPYQEVMDAMAYSLLSGGKRIRGVMVLAFYRLFAEDVRRALPFAAAVEMVHAYSLIHDDLPCMDDDDMRRGKPSCHVAYGEAVALLAGDALLTLAFETACTCGDFPPQRVLAAAAHLAQAAGIHGMVGGQGMDLKNEDKRLSGEELDGINRRKTGALFRACAAMGACLGGADEGQLAAGEAYADKVGVAFQIVDDILDVTADPALLGKPVGSDAENHKNTYAALYGLDACRERVDVLNREAKASLDAFGGDTEFLCALADMLGGRRL